MKAFACLVAWAFLGQQAAPLPPGLLENTVKVVNDHGRERGEASGAIVASDENRALVLTAGHVFDRGQGKLDVIGPNGQRLAGTALGRYKQSDLAAIETKTTPWTRGAGIAANPSRQCWLTGYPAGSREARTKIGRLLGTNAEGIATLDCDHEAQEGDSGAGVFDAEGKIQGIVSGYLGDREATVAAGLGKVQAITRTYWQIFGGGGFQAGVQIGVGGYGGGYGYAPQGLVTPPTYRSQFVGEGYGGLGAYGQGYGYPSGQGYGYNGQYGYGYGGGQPIYRRPVVERPVIYPRVVDPIVVDPIIIDPRYGYGGGFPAPYAGGYGAGYGAYGVGFGGYGGMPQGYGGYGGMPQGYGGMGGCYGGVCR